jgi:hypothetical protein
VSDVCSYCGGPHLSRDCPDEQEGMGVERGPALWSAMEVALGLLIGIVVVALIAMLLVFAFGAAQVCP